MPTILLVEGTRAKTSFAPLLERREYEVIRASNGKQALQQAKAHSPALIVLDAISSRIDGERLCRKIRARIDGVAILLMVRADAQVDAASSADYVLSAPVTPRRFLNRVSRMMPAGESAALTIGDLSLNVGSRCVRIGKKEHQLTPKQAHLLEILMRQGNAVVTRRHLMKAVWKTDYMGDTRTLDVHIRWLRQIIEVDASRPKRLVTVRNVGYRLKI